MRPKTAMPPMASALPPCVQPHAEGTLLDLKVQPRASRSRIEGLLGPELKVKVTAPPVDSAANAAVIELLAEQLDCSKGALAIVRGQTARHKVVLIRGLTPERVWQLLQRSS